MAGRSRAYTSHFISVRSSNVGYCLWMSVAEDVWHVQVKLVSQVVKQGIMKLDCHSN